MGGQVGLYVRKKSDDAKIRVDGTKALDGVERRGSGVQVNDDQCRRRLEKLQQRFGVGGNRDLQAEMLGGFGELHLEKKIVHVGYDARHWQKSPRGG